MRAAYPLDEISGRFLELVESNHVNAAILDRLSDLDLPDSYLVAGCLYQSVWNSLSGFAPTDGIDDYDISYFDDSDLSWKAEDEVIARCADLFSDLHVKVQVRNQARVHLWYPQKFSIAHAPLRGVREAIGTYLNQSSCFGARQRPGGFDVIAPFGYDDLFDMVVRPNPRRWLPEVYYRKAERWKSVWPLLTVLPWPDNDQ